MGDVQRGDRDDAQRPAVLKGRDPRYPEAMVTSFAAVTRRPRTRWQAALLVAGTLQFVAAVLTMVVMRPLRMRELRSQGVLAPASK